MKNIVIIGAGSLTFSSRLTADILTYPSLQDAHIKLVDTDEIRLDLSRQIVERIFKEGNYNNARVSASTDRKVMLKDADFVIISILVGGNKAIESEIDIPMKYGIDQCIGDTLTPGGIMRCLRTLPVLIDMAKDIAGICPNAVVMNYTNPMGMLTKGLMEAVPELTYVGLCHSVQQTMMEWAGRLEIPAEEVNYECAGINHQAWLTRFEHNGHDMMEHIRKLAEEPEIWYGDSVRMEYIKHFGYPVTESSGHVSEYVPWFRQNRESIDRYCNTEYSEWNGKHGFIKELYNRPDWKETMQKMADWEDPIDLKRSHEYGSMIINSIVTGEESVVHGNLLNKGYISNLPEDSVVEVPCLVDKNGIHPLHVGELPPHLAAINRTQLSVQELAVLAVQENNPERVFQAMALDPLTAMSCSLDEIRDMTKELLDAHSEWIPAFGGRSLSTGKKIYLEQPQGKVSSHIDPAKVNQDI